MILNGTGPGGEVGVGEAFGFRTIVGVGEALEIIGVEFPVWEVGGGPLRVLELGTTGPQLVRDTMKRRQVRATAHGRKE